MKAAVQELGAHAALVCALLGLVSSFAASLGPRLAEGGRLLRPVLAPTVQHLQSSCPAVRDAARHAAAQLCRFCGYQDLQVGGILRGGCPVHCAGFRLM